MCGVLPPASRTSSWHDNQTQGQCSFTGVDVLTALVINNFV
jgi:hypothetical protein